MKVKDYRGEASTKIYDSNVALKVRNTGEANKKKPYFLEIYDFQTVIFTKADFENVRLLLTIMLFLIVCAVLLS